MGLRLRWLRSGLTKAGGLTETGRLTERAAGDAGIAALTEARRAGLLAWLLAWCRLGAWPNEIDIAL